MGRSRRTLHAALEASATPPGALLGTQSVARVVQAEGNNLYTVQLPTNPPGIVAAISGMNHPFNDNNQDATKVLVELGTRFRNTVYMRRGGYVLVDLADAFSNQNAGRKVRGEIVSVVRDEKAWRKQPYWPAEFAKITYDDPEDDDSNMGKLPPSDSEEEEEEGEGKEQ